MSFGPREEEVFPPISDAFREGGLILLRNAIRQFGKPIHGDPADCHMLDREAESRRV
jgi:hypothetical protein